MSIDSAEMGYLEQKKKEQKENMRTTYHTAAGKMKNEIQSCF